MSFSIELHCPLGDANSDSFVKATIPAFAACLPAMNYMTADRDDQGADRTADVVRRKVMLCHSVDPHCHMAG
jgi:hypothetical protein